MDMLSQDDVIRWSRRCYGCDNGAFVEPEYMDEACGLLSALPKIMLDDLIY